MTMQWNSAALEWLGVLRARGSDAATFLQGQVSNDLTRLGADSSLLAGYHNPQGRAIALLRLVQLAPDDVLGILPRELSSVVAGRLGKFILRAKVKFTDESALWHIDGLLARAAASGAAHPHTVLLPDNSGAVRRVADTLIVRCGDSPERLLCVRPTGAAALNGVGLVTATDWRLAAIAAGEPQVYAATTEQFVAQMLNLDLMNAIAFDKGCYTGQEIIARAHYRGRVKRRMQRFLTQAPAVLKPGEPGELPDGRSFVVVEAAQHADGRCEFLAVAATEAEGATGDARAGGDSVKSALRVMPLALPYTLPQ